MKCPSECMTVPVYNIKFQTISSASHKSPTTTMYSCQGIAFGADAVCWSVDRVWPEDAENDKR